MLLYRAVSRQLGDWRRTGLLALLFVLQSWSVEAKQYAYVTTEQMSTVVAIDTDFDAVVGEIPLSIGSYDVAVTPDGKLAYIADPFSDGLTVVDLRSNAVVDRIWIGNQPYRVLITPDGRFAYAIGQPTVEIDFTTGSVTPLFFEDVQSVTVSPDARTVYFAVLGIGPEDAGLAVLDTATQTIRTAAPGFWAYAVGLSPTGRFVYLAGNRSLRAELRLQIVDVDSLEVVLDVPILFNESTFLYGVVGAADDSKVFVNTGYVVYVIDTATGRIHTILPSKAPGPKRWAVGADSALYITNLYVGALSKVDIGAETVTATLPLGTGPQGLSVSPDGRAVYVAADDGFYTVDTKTFSVAHAIPAGADPTGIAATADGRFLYVANYASGNVGVIDTEARLLTKSIQTGGKPLGIALTPDDQRAYVASFTYPGKVFVIDVPTNAVVAAIEVPGETWGIAITPDGKRVVVSNYDTGVISVIGVDTNSVRYQFGVSYGPMGIAISRDGRFGVIGTESAVQFFDPMSEDPTSPPLLGRVDLRNIVTSPCGLALSRDGSRAYVTDLEGGSVHALDAAERSLLASTSIAVPYGAASCGLALTPDDRRVYVANRSNNLVTVLDTDDLHIIHHVPVPHAPYDAVIVCPGGCPSPTPSPTITPTPTPTPPPPCYGDCNHDGRITVDELVIGVGIALDHTSMDACRSLDIDRNGRVSVDELVLAVSGALNGCQPLP